MLVLGDAVTRYQFSRTFAGFEEYQSVGNGLDSACAGLSLPGSTDPKDITCGVDVGVGTVPTREMAKHRLIYPVARFDVAAFSIGLTEVAEIHHHHGPTGAFSLVGGL